MVSNATTGLPKRHPLHFAVNNHPDRACRIDIARHGGRFGWRRLSRVGHLDIFADADGSISSVDRSFGASCLWPGQKRSKQVTGRLDLSLAGGRPLFVVSAVLGSWLRRSRRFDAGAGRVGVSGEVTGGRSRQWWGSRAGDVTG